MVDLLKGGRTFFMYRKMGENGVKNRIEGITARMSGCEGGQPKVWSRKMVVNSSNPSSVEGVASFHHEQDGGG